MLQDTRINYPLMSIDSEFEDSFEELFSKENAKEEGFPFDFESIEKKEVFEKIFIPIHFSSQNNEEFSHKAINQEEKKEEDFV